MKSLVKDRNGSVVEILMIVIIIVLFVVLGWLIYKDSHKKTTSPSKSKTASISTYVFKGLGITINMDSTLSGLSYQNASYNALVSGTSQTESYVTTPAYRSLVESDCSNKVTDPSKYSFEVLGEDKGTFPSEPDSTNSNGILIIQFTNFFIWRSNPSDGNVCNGLTSSQKQKIATMANNLAVDLTGQIDNASITGFN